MSASTEALAMNTEFLELLKRRIANTAILPATARNMGPPGTIDKVRAALRALDLKKLRAATERTYLKRLDAATETLQAALPARARHFGSARKFVNIYIRSCVYNRHICAAFELAQIEPFLEVPLDSHVAKGLLLEKGAEHLPRWTTVIGLTPEANAKYQAFALALAHRRGTQRIHLDLLYWRGDHMTKQFLAGMH